MNCTPLWHCIGLFGSFGGGFGVSSSSNNGASEDVISNSSIAKPIISYFTTIAPTFAPSVSSPSSLAPLVVGMTPPMQSASQGTSLKEQISTGGIVKTTILHASKCIARWDMILAWLETKTIYNLLTQYHAAVVANSLQCFAW